MISMLNSHILVKRDKGEQKKGALIVTRSDQSNPFRSGTITSLATRKEYSTETNLDPTPMVGDVIIYHIGAELLHDGEQYDVIKHGDIVAIIGGKK